MRQLLIILATFASQVCHCQELDIFQNDSIYSKNGISVRTMYLINGTRLQKELVTHYNSSGQKIKQLWYWNGDKDFHNVETFLYSDNGSISRLIDSFADGKVETTNYYYKNKTLAQRITIDQNNDTCDVRTYPDSKTTIKRWYMDGKSYRYDTTIFEKQSVKIEYYGIDRSYSSSKNYSWHYKFSNEFDSYGNLVEVSMQIKNPYRSFTRYTYDERNLLTKKQEVLYTPKKATITAEYYFIYE